MNIISSRTYSLLFFCAIVAQVNSRVTQSSTPKDCIHKSEAKCVSSKTDTCTFTVINAATCESTCVCISNTPSTTSIGPCEYDQNYLNKMSKCGEQGPQYHCTWYPTNLNPLYCNGQCDCIIRNDSNPPYNREHYCRNAQSYRDVVQWCENNADHNCKWESTNSDDIKCDGICSCKSKSNKHSLQCNIPDLTTSCYETPHSSCDFIVNNSLNCDTKCTCRINTPSPEPCENQLKYQHLMTMCEKQGPECTWTQTNFDHLNCDGKCSCTATTESGSEGTTTTESGSESTTTSIAPLNCISEMEAQCVSSEAATCTFVVNNASTCDTSCNCVDKIPSSTTSIPPVTCKSSDEYTNLMYRCMDGTYLYYCRWRQLDSLRCDGLCECQYSQPCERYSYPCDSPQAPDPMETCTDLQSYADIIYWCESYGGTWKALSLNPLSCYGECYNHL